VSGALRLVRLDSRRGRRAVERLVARGGEVIDRKVRRQAERIVVAVRRKGDAALLAAVRRHDGVEAPTAAALRLPPPDLEVERERLPPGFAEALDRAILAVLRHHELQVRSGFRDERDGVEIEEVRQPLARVGVYVPGGRAAYPSTVVMTVVPAQVAGVAEIAVATPPASFAASAPLRYALARLGVSEIWGMGGAQAVAAFAYGTAAVPRVDKIVGPGNAWVSAAKALVAGDVGIDGLAGPTEVVIVAGGDADPALVAADLLAQAEHDPRAAAVLVTASRGMARRVAGEVAVQLAALPEASAETARASLAAYGLAVIVASVEEALPLVERIAPEHLQLVGAEAEALAERVRAAGAVFVGAATSEVFGDYVAGPSHVLPTCGSARFASGLGVDDFVRRSHRVRFSAEAAARWASAAATLADAEGLPAHAAAARRRQR
jgi:histidinol dehydrogenase